jgi:hypothetical protein
MVKAEKARELLDLAGRIAARRSEVNCLIERRNTLQVRTHDVQTELRKLERERSELLVEIGVPLIVTEDPSRELLSEILKLIEGAEQ